MPDTPITARHTVPSGPSGHISIRRSQSFFSHLVTHTWVPESKAEPSGQAPVHPLPHYIHPRVPHSPLHTFTCPTQLTTSIHVSHTAHFIHSRGPHSPLHPSTWPTQPTTSIHVAHTAHYIHSRGPHNPVYPSTWLTQPTTSIHVAHTAHFVLLRVKGPRLNLLMT